MLIYAEWPSKIESLLVFRIIPFLLIFVASSIAAQTPEQAPRAVSRLVLPPKTFSKADVEKTCRKYSNRYISYYSKVYKVRNCLRRELDAESVRTLSKRIRILSVENDAIAMLQPGEPITESSRLQNCKELSNRYIISPLVTCTLCRNANFDYSQIMNLTKSMRKSVDVVLLLSFKRIIWKVQGGETHGNDFGYDHQKENIIETEVDVISLPRPGRC